MRSRRSSASAAFPADDKTEPIILSALLIAAPRGGAAPIKRHRKNAAPRRGAVFHARNNFLADVTALAKTHRPQLIEIRFMGKQLAGTNIAIAVGKPQGNARRVIARARPATVPFSAITRHPISDVRGSA